MEFFFFFIYISIVENRHSDVDYHLNFYIVVQLIGQTANVRSKKKWTKQKINILDLLIICSLYSKYETLKSRSTQTQSPFIIILKSRFICFASTVSNQMFNREQTYIYTILTYICIYESVTREYDRLFALIFNHVTWRFFYRNDRLVRRKVLNFVIVAIWVKFVEWKSHKLF